MTRCRIISLSTGLASMVVFGAAAAATTAADLSRYRTFQLGSDVATVARQAGTNLSDVKVIHQRPALIQEIAWRPGLSGPSQQSDSGKDVALRFFEGKLYQITVRYDRYDTQGLTNDDMVNAISALYGTATRPPAVAAATQRSFDDREEVLAQWEDSLYRFDLIRSALYGPGFLLIGVLKEVETPAATAIANAVRLDEQEAPAREAARVATEERAAGAKLDKARLENRPKFRP
jgi:hypothetical protein